MAKTILVPESSIIGMLKALPRDTLMDIFSKILIEGDASPLTDEEKASYKKALKEYEKDEVISWEDLK
jgi:hypothetical protein